jgi:DNA primase
MTEASDFKEIVKQQADIVRVVGDYVKLRKAGAQNYSGLCPFHGEKTPSLSVHATRQFFHCFGCGVSGDVFAFVQKIENITFPEAVRAVAQKLGIAMPRVSYSSPVEAKEARMRTVLLEVHERACAFFQECLRRPEGAHAREYLAGRGLDEETIKAFRIGYAPDSGFLLRDRLKSEFPEEELRESGLFSWKENSEIPPGLKPARNDKAVENDLGEVTKLEASRQKLSPVAMYSKFRNRVLFPLANETGRVIAFTGRTLATDEKSGPKYLNSPETPIYSKSRVLFNLDHAKEAIRKLDYAILVEGQMDCIAVFAAGFHNVIASSGTAFTELQAKLLGRFSKNVVVNFDPDTAGAKATERTLGLLVEEEFQIKVLTLEAGFDPDLFIRRKGKDAYAGELKKSQKYFDYLIETARAKFSTRSAETKVKAVNYLLPHIQRVPSRIVRDELAQEIAQRLGIDSSVLRQELKHAAGSRSTASVKAVAEAQITDAERILVRALASAGELLTSEERLSGARLSGRDGAEKDFDPARQAHFVLKGERFHIGLTSESLVEVFLNAGEECADVMQLPMSEGDRRLLASVLMSEHEELTAELLEEAVSALRRRQLEHRQRVIKTLIANAEHSKDLPTLTKLVQEKQEIDRALAS